LRIESQTAVHVEHSNVSILWLRLSLHCVIVVEASRLLRLVNKGS